MIVVGILLPSAAASTDPVVEIARRAAATGARTELVGVAPPDDAGDRLLVELAAAGVGHATVTRSAAGGIDSADLDLALRYLPDVRAIVLVRPSAALLAPAVAASSWTGATLVIVGALDADGTAALDAIEPTAVSRVAEPGPANPASSQPRGAIVLAPPATDPDGTFAGFVAALAARLDGGEDPKAAWQSTSAALAVDPV